MNRKQLEQLTNYLEGFITDERRQKINAIIRQRTRHLTFILENIYQPHNASAVLRSCEINGIQDVHIIENNNAFRPSKNVALGAARWLSLHHYNRNDNNTVAALQTIKQKGYTIAATTPHHHDYRPDEIPLEEPLALIFGTELSGLSKEALELADLSIQIPQYGFTESYNISVSAAICAYQLSLRLKKSGIPWALSDLEQGQLKLEWYKTSIKNADKLVARFLKEQQ
ncbi:MAG: RNA methyltransferase [Bacteroidales bacterium]